MAMIDLFGRKAKAELSSVKAQLEMMREDKDAAYRIAQASARDNDSLIAALREMDQLAFMIGQTYGQSHCLPHIQKLCAAADKRMKAESDRIRDVLIPELRQVYSKEDLHALRYSGNEKRIGDR